MGEFVVAKRVYKDYPIMFPNRVSYVEIVELDMLYFDIIMGIDWSHAFFASINIRRRVVKFKFPNYPVLELIGGISIPRDCIITYIKALKMISKGFLYHIVIVKDLDSEI